MTAYIARVDCFTFLKTIFLIVMVRQLMGLSDSANKCGGKAFGPRCRVSCKSCTGNCDSDTGACKSGNCLPNWSGFNCQKRNIALSSPTSSTPIDGLPSLVVDGNESNDTHSCFVITEKSSKPWWRLDLQKQHYISDIVLVSQLKYERNIVVYLSNSSAVGHSRTLCQKIPPAAVSPVHVICAQATWARYVTLQQPNVNSPQGRVLVLCEVQVWECSSGTYGRNCEKVCGDCVRGHQTCDKATGECLGGCKAGWVAPLCQEVCPPNHYGPNCSKKCQYCASNTPCNSVSGVCMQGCASGWSGLHCNKSCGGVCVHKCGKCLGGQSNCDTKYNTGECRGGCQSGYQLPNCNRSCFGGAYGINCSRPCGNCEGYVPCDIISGHCPAGCQPNWQGQRCNKALMVQDSPSDTDPNIGVIVGGILGAICIIVAALLVYLLITKKWYIKKRKPGQVLQNAAFHETATVPSIYNSSQSFQSDSNANHTDPASKQLGMTSSSVPVSVTSIPVDELQAYVEGMMANPLRYDTQFQLLPPEATSRSNTASLPFNKMKNRFSSIVPYDHNRVVLKTSDKDPLFDYINASYITGYKKKKAYIVTQAPMDSSIFDFWRMVWQESCTKIIILTNLAEFGQVKCAQYWSELESLQYGHLIVQLDSSLELTDYTLRMFTVTNAMDGESRIIRQFHFTSWLDHGTPHHSESLLTFRDLTLDTDPKHTGGPILVHCSAGIGRSGVFVAMDILIQQAEHKRVVDVFSVAKALRLERVQMIPSPEQYKFVYEALLDYVNFGPTAIRYSDLASEYVKMKDNGASCMHEQFERIQMMCKVCLNDIDTALCVANVDKNRNHHILAGDAHRLYLSTRAPGSTDYINAVKIHGCKQKTEMFANEVPMPHTVVDMWRLIFDHNTSTIVLLGDIACMNHTVGVYWVDEPGVSVVEPFQVEMLSSRYINDTTVERVFRIKMKQGMSKERVVKQFHFMALPPDQTTLPDKADLLTLIENVARWQHENSSSPVIVQCLDGATYTGLYCTVVTILEQLDLLKLVDVSRTVRMMRVARPQFIPTLEQYEYLYEVVNFYMARLENT